MNTVHPVDASMSQKSTSAMSNQSQLHTVPQSLTTPIPFTTASHYHRRSPFPIPRTPSSFIPYRLFQPPLPISAPSHPPTAWQQGCAPGGYHVRPRPRSAGDMPISTNPQIHISTPLPPSLPRPPRSGVVWRVGVGAFLYCVYLVHWVCRWVLYCTVCVVVVNLHVGVDMWLRLIGDDPWMHHPILSHFCEGRLD